MPAATLAPNVVSYSAAISACLSAIEILRFVIYSRSYPPPIIKKGTLNMGIEYDLNPKPTLSVVSQALAGPMC